MRAPENLSCSADRRDFIRQAIFLTLAITAPPVLLQSCGTSDSYKTIPEGQLTKLCGTDVVQNIGKKWIALHPQENSLSVLKSTLLAGSKWNNYDNVDLHKLAAYLHEKSAAEFAAFKTVINEGWVLSDTDCRIAAVYFLDQSQQS